MSYGFGEFIGSLIAVGFLSVIFRFALHRFFSGPPLAAVTVAIASLVATFAYAFGSADGGEPRFGAGLVQYGFAGVLIFGLWLFGLSRKKHHG